MSYSFTITGNTKTEVADQVETKFNEVVATQPRHAADKEAVINAAHHLIDIMAYPQDDDQEISVSMYGSLSWETDSVDDEYIGASMTVNVVLRKKT